MDRPQDIEDEAAMRFFGVEEGDADSIQGRFMLGRRATGDLASAKAFSDGRITNPEYIDAGTSSSRNSMAKAQTRAVRFPEAHGTPDVAAILRSLAFRQRRADGFGNGYYDQYTLLTQLGHIRPLAAAA